MYMHPHLSSLIGLERQREMMAHARRQRLGRQVSDLARASRGGDGTARRRRRPWRTALPPQLLPRHRAAR